MRGMLGPRAWRESGEDVYTPTPVLNRLCTDQFWVRCTTHRRILRAPPASIAGHCNPSAAWRRGGAPSAKISGYADRSEWARALAIEGDSPLSETMAVA